MFHWSACRYFFTHITSIQIGCICLFISPPSLLFWTPFLCKLFITLWQVVSTVFSNNLEDTQYNSNPKAFLSANIPLSPYSSVMFGLLRLLFPLIFRDTDSLLNVKPICFILSCSANLRIVQCACSTQQHNMGYAFRSLGINTYFWR